MIAFIKSIFKEWRCRSVYFRLLKRSFEMQPQVQVPPENDIRMYVLINRPILTIIQAGVQGAHASIEYMHKFKNEESTIDWVENHKTLIFLQATEEDLQDMKRICEASHIPHAEFIEPDIGYRLTAIAFKPMSKDEGKFYFGKFPLLK